MPENFGKPWWSSDRHGLAPSTPGIGYGFDTSESDHHDGCDAHCVECNSCLDDSTPYTESADGYVCDDCKEVS